MATMLGGCSLLGLVGLNEIQLGSGTMIVRYGAYIYRIGGTDSLGDIRTTIMMAKATDALGQPLSSNAPLEWIETASLPEGRAFGAAFAVRNMMYIIGGDSDSGPTATVFTTKINATDGTLGIGTSRFWETSSMPLATPRSHMAWVIHDGRLFLIGGKNGNGAESSIVHARFYVETGRTGRWYESPQKLPAVLYGAGAAVLDGRLEIAGGINSWKRASNRIFSYALGADGLLSDFQEGTLPKALSYPVCIPDGDSLLVAGGYDSDNLASQSVYRRRNAAWITEAATMGAEGPTFAKIADVIWFGGQSPDDDDTGVDRVSGFTSTPDRLIVIPGSGMVPANSVVYMKPEPGTTVRYRTDTNEVTSADTAWTWDNETTKKRISASSTLSLRSFYADGTAGEQVPMQYEVRSAIFFTWISGDFSVKSATAGLETASVSDNLFNPASTGYTTAWGRLILDQKVNLALSFADRDSTGSLVAYTGRIKLTLYEDDLFTVVPDIDGVPVRDYTTASSSQPILLKLNPGAYHLRIEEQYETAPGTLQTGGTFGLAFRQR
ncbi:MAG: hypothetical protein WC935_06505 [Thermoleophilia bacterium]